MNGKGSKPRPFSVSQKEYDEKFNKINWNKNTKSSKKDGNTKK
jgi:hypothetical protein